MFEYRAELLRVIDGDTIDVLVDLGFNCFVRQRLRLADIDTPEMRGPEREAGGVAKQYLIALLDASSDDQGDIASGTILTISTRKVPRKSRDKYGRYVATVYVQCVAPATGQFNVNEEMVSTGHAKRWEP